MLAGYPGYPSALFALIKVMIKRHKNSLGKRLMGFAGVSVATLGIGFPANAGEKTWDFETDPFDEFPYIASSQEDFVWGGQGWDDWGAEGNPGGFFSISEATGGTWTIAVLPDIDNGEFVKAFNMKMDLRMGNGTTDRPADGISINFARSEGPGVDGDPMLADLDGGSATQNNAAAGCCAAESSLSGSLMSCRVGRQDLGMVNCRRAETKP